MFGRRVPLSWRRRLAELVWPRMGWRRTTAYLAHRVRRLPGTPYRIAAGFACGAAISFTPFIGFHFIGAALLALLVRGSVVASAIGTVVGNPWTFPFIWAWTYTFGNWLLGGPAITTLPDGLSFDYIFNHPMEVLWPMTVGGIPTAVVAWFAFFWPIRAAVAEYQLLRHQRIFSRMRTRQRRLAAKRISDGKMEGS